MVRGMGTHARWGSTGIRHQHLPTSHLAQGSRLCYTWFEACGPMPPGVQPGSGLPIWLRVPGSATHGSRNVVPGPMPPRVQRGSVTKHPRSLFGPGCPAGVAWAPMPPGVQTGSGTKTFSLDAESRRPESHCPESRRPKSRRPESQCPESRSPESQCPERRRPENQPPERRRPVSLYPQSR